MTATMANTGYAPVNGLEMYYEIHGIGEPLVLLHGAFATIGMWGPILEGLAAERQVIAVEFQGHGHTADIDRPFGFEQSADDIAALMEHLGIAQADVFGYSLGGSIALQVAMRHPERVRKLVAASATYHSDGYYPAILDGMQAITPEMFAGSPTEAAYLEVAPDPAGWPALIEKVKRLGGTPQDWPAADVAGIASPTLLIYGDADVIRPEHAVALFRLLGGGVAGDIVGLPRAQLAILPGTTHVSLVDENTERLVAMVEDFLAQPLAEPVP